MISDEITGLIHGCMKANGGVPNVLLVNDSNFEALSQECLRDLKWDRGVSRSPCEYRGMRVVRLLPGALEMAVLRIAPDGSVTGKAVYAP